MRPGGVEYKELWELTAWDKLFNGMDINTLTYLLMTCLHWNKKKEM